MNERNDLGVIDRRATWKSQVRGNLRVIDGRDDMGVVNRKDNLKVIDRKAT